MSGAMNLIHFSQLLAVASGGAVGACLRWALGLWLNPLSGTLPLGTLAANLGGGLLMGISLALIEAMPALPPTLKLLLTTGFLGGLTTFSTFSAESLQLLQRGAFGSFCLHLLLHLGGALFATWLGHALITGLRG